MSDTTPRRLLSLVSIGRLLDCSAASVRRRSLGDPTFPAMRNVNNRLFAFEDEIAAWIEARPIETKKPTKFQTKHIGEEPALK